MTLDYNNTKSKLSQEELETIRNVSIHKLMGLQRLVRTSVKCPFHNDKSPSCALYPDNSFHCFGCGAHGKGAIDFITKMGYSFGETVEELKKYI